MKDFWDGMGYAVIIIAICLGPASCSYIGAKTDAIKADTKARYNTITITNSFNYIEEKP